MSFAILVIVVLIVVALLLVGGGLVLFFIKRNKGGGAPAVGSAVGHQVPAPPIAYPEGPAAFGAHDPGAAPPWPPAQQWGAPPEPVQQVPEWPAPEPVPTPDAPAPSPYPAPRPSSGGVDQGAYVTTPGAPPSEPQVPAPELFMTTPGSARQTSMMNMQAHLRADDGTLIPLDRLMLRVGRHPECDIVVPTPGASRQHAEFEFRDGQWIVSDLNSGNGTFVNGVRVASHQLSAGDEVRIDQTRFTFATDT